MLITTNRAVEIYNALKTQEKVAGVRWANAVSRNLTRLQEIVDGVSKASEPSERYGEFLNKRQELAMTVAERDEDGEPVMVSPGSYKIADPDAWKVGMEGLLDEYSEAISEREEQNAELGAMLEEEIEFEPFRFDINRVPDSITGEILRPLRDIVVVGELDEGDE